MTTKGWEGRNAPHLHAYFGVSLPLLLISLLRSTQAGLHFSLKLVIDCLLSKDPVLRLCPYRAEGVLLGSGRILEGRDKLLFFGHGVGRHSKWIWDAEYFSFFVPFVTSQTSNTEFQHDVGSSALFLKHQTSDDHLL